MSVVETPSLIVKSGGRDVGFATAVIFILAILFLPIPPVLIDLGLAISIAMSVLVLMVALWISRPLEFSSFPTILLIATMLRLSMNIATTRSILAEGHNGINAAGYVIGGFSQFVMGGDFVIGVIVFLILVIVNFIVITKGSTRIAEVGARFTLDAIPGKQMSIDADLSAGLIDEKEAQSRRRELEEESSFFGSMDGASKFVRGDAIAGLIITAINIFGGIIIGYARHDMTLMESADIFTKLSVGDGLVSQIPALIISLAAGLLVSKGGTRGSADQAVLGQLGRYPKALQMSAGLMVLFALMPGLPFLPFIILASILLATGMLINRRNSVEGAQLVLSERKALEDIEQAESKSVKSSLKTTEVEVVLGRQLASYLLPKREEMAFRMSKMRKKFASQYGFVIPDIQLRDDLDLHEKSYRISIYGSPAAQCELRLGELMILLDDKPVPDIPGTETTEPAFGMRAYSVPDSYRGEVERLGLNSADNVTIILTHISETIRNNLPQLLSFRDMKMLIAGLDPEYRTLCEEMCTKHISYSSLQAILRLLLAERVSIRNLHLILEAVAEVAPHMRRAEKIVEHVRMRTAQQLCSDLSHDGKLPVLRLGNHWDMVFHESLKRDVNGEVVEFDLDPARLEEFGKAAVESIKMHSTSGTPFALITTPEVRPYIRMVTERLYPNLPVLSHVEVARGVSLEVIGSIS